MFTRLTALTVAATMFASGVSAYESKTLEVLENLVEVKTEDFERRLLGAAEGTLEEQRDRRERLQSAQEDWEIHAEAGADLSSAKLSGVHLEGINLYAANLSGADLSGSILSGAGLFRADLSGADLSGALLDEAELTRAIMNGAILCNTTMPGGSVIYSGC